VQKYDPVAMLGIYSARTPFSIIGRLNDVPVRVIREGTTPSVAKYYTKDASIAKRLQRSLVLQRKKLTYNLFPTHITTVSEAARHELVHFYGLPPEKVVLLHNAMQDPVDSKKRIARARWQRREQLERGEPVLVSAARFVPLKGHDVLLQALRPVADRYPGVMLVLMGDGEVREECEQMAEEFGVEEHCVFLGTVPHAEVLERMMHANVSVLPSYDETSGRVNMEALSVGTPVVTTDVGGISDYVRDGKDGFLVPPGDATLLARNVLDILDDASLQRRMSENAREHFLRKFELQGMLDRHIGWLESLIGKQPEAALSQPLA
jgi:glycosyltransferase involved in cell wall biosynthesis